MVELGRNRAQGEATLAQPEDRAQGRLLSRISLDTPGRIEPSPKALPGVSSNQAGSGFPTPACSVRHGPPRDTGQYGLCVHMMHVAIARVASHAAEPNVLGLDGGHLVPRDCVLGRPDVDPVEPR
jgi:hypothetical protein